MDFADLWVYGHSPCLWPASPHDQHAPWYPPGPLPPTLPKPLPVDVPRRHPVGHAAILALPHGLPGFCGAVPRDAAPPAAPVAVGIWPNRPDEILLPTLVGPRVAAPFVHHLAEAHGNKAISNTLGRGPVIDMLVHRILHHRRNHM